MEKVELDLLLPNIINLLVGAALKLAEAIFLPIKQPGLDIIRI
jgi:ABC-type enterobactin transport system permease subunit